jgi:hypothetical protein
MLTHSCLEDAFLRTKESGSPWISVRGISTYFYNPVDLVKNAKYI